MRQHSTQAPCVTRSRGARTIAAHPRSMRAAPGTTTHCTPCVAYITEQAPRAVPHTCIDPAQTRAGPWQCDNTAHRRHASHDHAAPAQLQRTRGVCAQHLAPPPTVPHVWLTSPSRHHGRSPTHALTLHKHAWGHGNAATQHTGALHHAITRRTHNCSAPAEYARSTWHPHPLYPMCGLHHRTGTTGRPPHMH
jgi:hypothetical protein